MATPVRGGRLVGITQWSGITPLDNVSGWHINALREVHRLAALPDDWDGYGSPRIQDPAREEAARLLAVLALLKPPVPHIAPVPGGGLQLEWSYHNRELEFEILPDGRLDFLATTEQGVMIEETLSDWKRQVPYLISWLLTGR